MTEVRDLRIAASEIARMTDPAAQIRALETLARHRLSDPQSLDELARLFPAAGTLDVQRAIAAVFIRPDYESLPRTGNGAAAERIPPEVLGRRR